MHLLVCLRRDLRLSNSNYLSSLPLATSPYSLLYLSISDGMHIISTTSYSGDCNLMGNLFMATHGFVYIFGSSIVTVNSKLSWSTRWKRSSTRIASLTGRPVSSSQALSSPIVPTVWTTSVLSSTHLPAEYPYHFGSGISFGRSRPSVQMVRHLFSNSYKITT